MAGRTGAPLKKNDGKMAKLTIYSAGDPVLHRKARPVNRIDGALRALLDNMVETMREHNGMGLAGPQVGVLQRIFVAEYEEAVHTFINPEITWRSAETEVLDEGCLSLPGYVGKVERPLKVTIKGRNKKGKNVTLQAEGVLARCFQHEMDHLDGIMYTDRMAPDERLRVVTHDEEETLADARV
jgi:peptide deformylase